MMLNLESAWTYSRVKPMYGFVEVATSKATTSTENNVN